ncbi:MAG: peptidylprolyl isomerase [Fimbriimonadaceae bacterium]
MMQKTIGIGVLLAGGMVALAYQTAPPYWSPRPHDDDVVVARYRGGEIKAAELTDYLWNWRAWETANELAALRLIEAEAAARGISVTQDEVQAKLKATLDPYEAQLPAGSSLEAELRAQGIQRARLYDRERIDLLATKMALANFSPQGYVKVSTIVIRPKSNRIEDLSEAIKKAEEAYDRLAKGEAWGAVLGAYVDDPTAVRSEGFLGWRPIDAFPATLQDALKSASAQEVTRPVQTDHGIQIFRVEATGSTATESEMATLRSQVLQSELPSLLDRIRKEAQVELLWPLSRSG